MRRLLSAYVVVSLAFLARVCVARRASLDQMLGSQIDADVNVHEQQKSNGKTWTNNKVVSRPQNVHQQQKSRNGKTWTNNKVVSRPNTPTKPVKCRIIGPGSGCTLEANNMAAAVITEYGCTVVDWDGDAIAPGKFSNCLSANFSTDIDFQPHGVEADVGGPLDTLTEEQRESRAKGNADVAPDVEPVTERQLEVARAKIEEQLGPNAINGKDANFNKYTALAVADVQAQIPDWVIWQVDLVPIADYWKWVSLAEYKVFPHNKYILIDMAGNMVDDEDWFEEIMPSSDIWET